MRRTQSARYSAAPRFDHILAFDASPGAAIEWFRSTQAGLYRNVSALLLDKFCLARPASATQARYPAPL